MMSPDLGPHQGKEHQEIHFRQKNAETCCTMLFLFIYFFNDAIVLFLRQTPGKLLSLSPNRNTPRQCLWGSGPPQVLSLLVDVKSTQQSPQKRGEVAIKQAKIHIRS